MTMSKTIIEPLTTKTDNRQLRVLYGHCLNNRNHPAARMVHQIAAELAHLKTVVHVHEPELTNTQASSSATSQPASTDHPPVTAQPGGSGRVHAKKFQAVRDKLWFAKTMMHDRAAIGADLQAIRAFRPDVVVARHDAYRGSLVRAASFLKIPVVVYADAPVAHETRHWSDSDTPAGRRYHPPMLVEQYEKHHLRLASAIVAVSGPGRDCIEQYRLGRPVEIIRNGVGPEYLGPPSVDERDRLRAVDERDRLRAELGLRTPHVAGFVGTFKPFHGIDMLGSIIRAMHGRHDLGWLLVGDGPCKKSLMESLGDAAGRVVDLGVQPAERLPLLYRLMDIAVAPYPAGQNAFHFCPLKIIEAQASGVAVVASARGDIPAMLNHGRHGIPVAEESVGQWVSTIETLLNNPARRLEIGQTAQKSVQKNQTWANSAQALHKLLIQLCEVDS